MPKTVWFPSGIIKKIKLNQKSIAAFENLHRYDWILFTSKNTVNFFIKELHGRNIKIPSNIKIAAVGPETARVLKKAGFKINLIPKKFSTDNLISALGKKVAGKRFLFPRSAIADKNSIQTLRINGARVDVVHLYTVSAPRITNKMRTIITKGKADYVVFTSSSSVAFFAKEFTRRGDSFLKDITAVCIGLPTASAARALPFKKICTPKVSTKAGIESLLRRLP